MWNRQSATKNRGSCQMRGIYYILEVYIWEATFWYWHNQDSTCKERLTYTVQSTPPLQPRMFMTLLDVRASIVQWLCNLLLFWYDSSRPTNRLCPIDGRKWLTGSQCRNDTCTRFYMYALWGLSCAQGHCGQHRENYCKHLTHVRDGSVQLAIRLLLLFIVYCIFLLQNIIYESMIQ